MQSGLKLKVKWYKILDVNDSDDVNDVKFLKKFSKGKFNLQNGYITLFDLLLKDYWH